jgi:GxxExxY protein
MALRTAMAITYDDIALESGYLADLIVDSQVILELKSIERILPLHEALLLTRSGRAA